MKLTGWQDIGTVGINTGTLVVGDPANVMDIGWDEEMPRVIAALGQRFHTLTSDGEGIHISTGWGDGAYPVYVKYMRDAGGPGDGRPAAVLICFDGEADPN